MKTLVLTSIALIFLLSVLPAAAKEPQFTYRGIWVDTGSFATKAAADKLLDQCSRAKINVILPNVMVHGSVMHKSTHYLHNVVANDTFDPLAYLCKEAHAKGMQVHPWYSVYYEGVKGLTPCNPEWLCTDMDGKRMDDTYFLSPQVPGVNDYLLSVIKDGLAYDVDGIHLDYIRYFGSMYDYSDKGREGFVKSYGFDPKDFLDNGERIVPDEPFPVRVIHAERHKSRTWEQTWVESLMDRAGIGFSFISEKPENVDSLRAPGLLVFSIYYTASPEMSAAIERYVQRGGSVLCIDGLSAGADPKLYKIFGLKPGSIWHSADWHTLSSVGDGTLAKRIPPYTFKSNINEPGGMAGGTVVASFNTGEPAVVTNEYGKGHAALVTFNASQPVGAGSPQLIRTITDWLREQSGVNMDRDLMMAKREAWISWKANHITELVKNVHDAVKAKDPKLVVSAAGGFSWNEHYIIFRDGRRWMDEGLVDIANPMDYFDDIRDLREYLALHKASATAEQLKNFYPGLSLYTSKTVGGKKTSVSQDAKVVREQLDLVRDTGYRGYTLFCSAQLNEDLIKVLAEAAK